MLIFGPFCERFSRKRGLKLRFICDLFRFCIRTAKKGKNRKQKGGDTVRYKERYGYLLAATLSVAALLCTAALLMMLPKNEKSSPKSQPIAASETKAAEETGEEPQKEGKYIMKLYNGSLAVFDAKKPDTPQYITGIDERTLRDADRKAFEKGVLVYSDEELASLLEDYGS